VVSRWEVVDRGVLQAMWEELVGKVLYAVINSLSDNHDYLKTLYRMYYDNTGNDRFT